MSSITNCILSFHILEHEDVRLREVHRASFLREQQFRDISESFGGLKQCTQPTYGAAFKNIVPKELIDHIFSSAGWKYPQWVQLFISDEYNETYILHNRLTWLAASSADLQELFDYHKGT